MARWGCRDYRDEAPDNKGVILFLVFDGPAGPAIFDQVGYWPRRFFVFLPLIRQGLTNGASTRPIELLFVATKACSGRSPAAH